MQSCLLRYKTLLLFYALVFTAACRQNQLRPELQEGKDLAQIHCSSCHMLPEPELLDQKTWTGHVLPAMAPSLGIGVWSGTQYFKSPGNNSGISIADWTKIVNYYAKTAPRALIPAHRPTPLLTDWAGFVVKIPAAKHKADAATTLLTFDTISKTIYSGDALSSVLEQWNKNLQLRRAIKTVSPAVGALFSKGTGPGEAETVTLTSIGSLQALDIPNGSVDNMSAGLPHSNKKTIARGLFRPVQTSVADFNKDGLDDYAICSFGHNRGGLDLFTQQKDGTYKRSVIREVPGAEQVITGDFNHDGWTDLMVLFAQADEGIWLFLNNKQGGFSSRNILRFPSVYGSSSFQLLDFNKDGKPDILYTCGDNADYSMILKPFHGVYIYTNEGDFSFKKSWFYPVNGCTKAIAADFRHSGQPDIAAIAFYADQKNGAKESFIYFRQDKPMKFSAHAIPVSGYGRWLTMAVADYDLDGDDDILLGSFSIPFITGRSVPTGHETKNPFIVLENQYISKK